MSTIADRRPIIPAGACGDRYNRERRLRAQRAGIMIEDRVRELKQIIASNDGRNAADARFTRAVDELVSAVYDDIGEVSALSARTLFDLFVIKVLYVGRHSVDAGVIEYLGALLETCLLTSELFPPDTDGRPRRLYFSDMLDSEKRPRDVENIFEAYRKYADGALFLSGVFAPSLRPQAKGAMRLRRRTSPGIDAAYYVSTGKAMYRIAARDGHAACAHQPGTLSKLADHFEVYVDALNEMSERYIMGFDMHLIADKMLDGFNRYRASRDGQHLASARRYAAILRVDDGHFPQLGS
jgi:hypothetical protein